MRNQEHLLMQGKKGLVTGIANNMSISWAIAELLKEHGAEIALTYQTESLKSRVHPLATKLNSEILEKCDITDSNSIDNLFNIIKSQWGRLDFIVHSIAFSDRNELRGRYIDTSLENFLNSMHISCYSLTEIARKAESLMEKNGAILTLSYYGAEKVIPGYNVMGLAKAALETSVKYLSHDMGANNIRINAISAGPIRTLASSGIGDFKAMLKIHENTAPLKRNITQQEVAKSALYLLSDLSSGVTGEIHYVDSGYNVMGTGINH
ncbi:enoyl-ACP reductase FabI [Rickettsia endosymbiont of Cardiosporidium cionae]|uniref:enoyl-ACP reductase FabI n=1 Tax=Rickettsia endosymbiont of Cardiosporidium cionae TaxID=2777155 RepID=UPI001894C3F5|nr:enoyl-ACP reductase [Rickettsia endosymbiont of Cardiosporidium cionae]KAF8818582.1 enoyl-[acyl-carrier-protein] reductase FabI [Rickettsia endosymbiont of Cardiosporidium cionae]